MLGMLRYMNTRDQSNVEDIKDGVCGFYATLHTEYCYSFYSCRRCQRYYVLCIQWPLAPARREGYFLQYSIWKAFRLGGLAVHHQSVWGGSFVNFLGLVKLEGWLQARHTANPQFLKLRGTQQPGNSYISMGTKLHPPYPNQTACLVYQFRSEKCLQCLKNVGLYNSFGVGRFSFWQSWLTQASRLANSQASASNAGVPGDPNLPESNCLYLALIWSIKELYSLWASCTVIKKTGLGMMDVIWM